MPTDKVEFIKTLFEKNVTGHPKAISTNEDGKKVLCLLVGKDNVSVLILDSFIENNSNQEIALFFDDNYIYSEIEKTNGELYLDTEDAGITIWHQDPPCQDLNKRKSS